MNDQEYQEMKTRAENFAENGDLEKAVNLYTDLLQFLQSSESAGDDLDTGLNLTEEILFLFHSRALARFSAGDYQGAFDDNKSIMKMDPSDSTAALNGGFAAYYLCSNDKAEECFSSALTADPEYAPAYAGRGMVYSETGHYEQALADFEKAREYNCDYEELDSWWGQCLVRLGRYEEALNHFQKNWDEYKRLPAAAGMGHCFFLLGRFADSEKLLTEVVSRAPQDYTSLIYLQAARHMQEVPEL